MNNAPAYYATIWALSAVSSMLCVSLYIVCYALMFLNLIQRRVKIAVVGIASE